MREIKFRVWDQGNRRMYQPALKLLHGEHPKPLEPDTKNKPSPTDPKNWTWLQYTGLKDKKGVEIYEGDILLFDDGEKSIVEYGAIEDYYIGFLPFDGNFEYDVHAHQCRVIGNIYENPELLSE